MVILPWLSAFDIDDVAKANDVIDQEVTIAAQDLEGNTETIDATIVEWLKKRSPVQVRLRSLPMV